MKPPIILQFLSVTLFLTSPVIQAQDIWQEYFNIPGKGVWGVNNDSTGYNMEGITTWTLAHSGVSLADSEDYAKTVPTSGGRFECRDIDGEVTWQSEIIDISGYNKVTIQLTAYETGSGANPETKYLKALYRLNKGEPVPFSTNGTNTGNWGSREAIQDGIQGETLQIICVMGNHYANDKVTLDEVRVWAKQETGPPVQPFEIVINEIMADPWPVKGLPRAEYIELFNTRSTPVNTSGWQLRVNGETKDLPPGSIAPDEYLILCSASSGKALQPFGNIATVPGFQGLLNNGASVEILNEKKTVIDRTDYKDTWYGDEEKNDGGWSLERIDPNRHCHQKGNWSASVNPRGGTPGSENSILQDNPDNQPPRVKWVAASSQHIAEISFSEPMDTNQLRNHKCFLLENEYPPDSIRWNTPERAVLRFNQPFQKNITYSLKVKGMADKCGNPLPEQIWEIQWITIEPDDVVINEILFDPFPGGKDYVEIFNCSEKRIPFYRLWLANRDKQGKLNQVYRLSPGKYPFEPHSWLALTQDTNAVFPWYFIDCPSCFLQMERLPSYPNSGGAVVLLNDQMEIIDEFHYTDKMHSPFLADPEGIALERISVKEATNNPGNWHSASTQSGYGTPGYRNSQSGKDLPEKFRIRFEPEAFSPNLDGFNDEYLIHYTLEKQGYLANIFIFDVNGQPVMQLAKNEILGPSGTISWDGKDQTGSLQPPGMYVVLVEIFNAGGVLHRIKDGITLTRKMD